MKKLFVSFFVIGFLLITVSVFANSTIQANKNNFGIKYFGSSASLQTYNIDGFTYLKLRDVSKLFKTPLEFKNEEILIGDNSKASVLYYVSDISIFPNLEDDIGLPLTDIHITGSSTTFKFVTPNISYNDVLKKIDQNLTHQNFIKMSDKEVLELAKSINDFGVQKEKSTYKIKDGILERYIQVLNSGLDDNNIPIISIIMR